ncbi:MAG: F0F1 ATP synthase subunit delta [Desulfobacterales bacterium]|nr:F0F1 ATP synthase subunit delta [Desulfobacterales bacterium]
MKKMVIARRYASALLLIAKEDGQAEDYKNELNGFSELLQKEKKLSEALINPLYPLEERKNLLEALTGKLGLSNVIRSFLMLLFDKRRLVFVVDITEFYSKLVDELKGIVRATLVSATDLANDMKEKIRDGLGKMTGKDVVLDYKVEPSLIGGVVTKIGNLVLDGSIKTQLNNMRESLKRGDNI